MSRTTMQIRTENERIELLYANDGLFGKFKTWVHTDTLDGRKINGTVNTILMYSTFAAAAYPLLSATGVAEGLLAIPVSAAVLAVSVGSVIAYMDEFDKTIVRTIMSLPEKIREAFFEKAKPIRAQAALGEAMAKENIIKKQEALPADSHDAFNLYTNRCNHIATALKEEQMFDSRTGKKWAFSDPIKQMQSEGIPADVAEQWQKQEERLSRGQGFFVANATTQSTPSNKL